MIRLNFQASPECPMTKFAAWVLSLCCVVSVAMAQEFPFWERLLSHYGGKSDETPVPSMKMGNHMQMSLKVAPHPGDEQRAQQIVAEAHEVLIRYADVNVALQQGYKPFFPTGRLGEEVHYTNHRFARREQQHVDYRQPGSILYRRTPDGMKAVGVMYTAPRDSTPEQLDRVAPLSIATWHRHVDFCGGPRTLPLKEQFGRGAQFGPQGSIQTEEACDAAHGLWIPVVFGWMTHVYPDEKETWAGMDMEMQSNTEGPKVRTQR
jgi:hypothetical protein